MLVKPDGRSLEYGAHHLLEKSRPIPNPETKTRITSSPATPSAALQITASTSPRPSGPQDGVGVLIGGRVWTLKRLKGQWHDCCWDFWDGNRILRDSGVEVMFGLLRVCSDLRAFKPPKPCIHKAEAFQSRVTAHESGKSSTGTRQPSSILSLDESRSWNLKPHISSPSEDLTTRSEGILQHFVGRVACTLDPPNLQP